jgi:hypothetical protein
MSYDGILTHLEAIERKLTKSNKIASKGDKINYKDALKLGTKSNSIVSTISKGIQEYSVGGRTPRLPRMAPGFNTHKPSLTPMLLQTFTPSEEQERKLLAKMNTIVELSETQLGLLVQHKDHFEKLKVGGLVKRNLHKSLDAGKNLSDAMIAKATPATRLEAETLEKRRAASFSKAISAFEGATGGEDAADNQDDSD